MCENTCEHAGMERQQNPLAIFLNELARRTRDRLRKLRSAPERMPTDQRV